MSHNDTTCAHFGCDLPPEMRTRGFAWCLTHGLFAAARKAATA